MSRILEACIDDFESALSAFSKGAHNAEVCSALDLDGLTPDVELVKRLANETSMGLKIMIRNRGGNFEYTPSDIAVMTAQIQDFKEIAIDGFVLGATKTSHGRTSIDIPSIIELSEACHPFAVTIHKAIDTCDDILGECVKLLDITNVKFILTSGGKATAWEGRDVLSRLRNILEPNIYIIGAGKVTSQNVHELALNTGLTYFHGKRITN